MSLYADDRELIPREMGMEDWIRDDQLAIDKPNIRALVAHSLTHTRSVRVPVPTGNNEHAALGDRQRRENVRILIGSKKPTGGTHERMSPV